jgi:hypothetical protein
MAEKIIYSAGSGLNDPMFGKFVHPIKALIENESNLIEKQKTILDVLFNVEKSNRYAETVMGESDFDTFQSVAEGGSTVRDSVQKTFDKTIEHIEFKKKFEITRKMADDAKFGMGANMKNAPKKFVRAYYKTKVKLAAQALINGTSATMTFNGATVDLKTGDGLALFHKAHPYSRDDIEGTQANFFAGDFTSSQEKFEESLNVLANKVRNFKTENGDTMGYVADVLIIPCNRPHLEMMAKKICGSERTTGTANNDINTQYGNWTLVVLDGWETTDDRFMVMSSEANESLLANMFFNRVNLDIRYGVDDKDTFNMYWNGYCRFGVGFTTWKHIALAVDGENASAEAI